MDYQNHIRHHRNADESNNRDKFFKIRNILNIIFMFGAIAGMLVYFSYDHSVGIIIILTAMVFKLTECCLRLLRQ